MTWREIRFLADTSAVHMMCCCFILAVCLSCHSLRQVHTHEVAHERQSYDIRDSFFLPTELLQMYNFPVQVPNAAGHLDSPCDLPTPYSEKPATVPLVRHIVVDGQQDRQRTGTSETVRTDAPAGKSVKHTLFLWLVSIVIGFWFILGLLFFLRTRISSRL